jgi:hypothetical protein
MMASAATLHLSENPNMKIEMQGQKFLLKKTRTSVSFESVWTDYLN